MTKKLGLVGGISWVSTIDYYRIINEGVNARLGGLNFAECAIVSVNFADFVRNNTAGDWDATADLLATAAEQLKAAGAEGIVLCANTAHAVADQVGQRVGLPLIHVGDATAAAIRARGLTRVGLLGTQFTMELPFYRERLQAHGIEMLVPDTQSERDFIQATIRDELGRGVILAETKRRYLQAIDDLLARGAEGIILGCTELPLILSQADLAVPVFDTTRIHAEAAVEFALSS
ncbi:MAG: aspartate/glutamate racemase family protein [Gemmatimonadetes bacterium]|nr:aspartate/glutamate racemase family protein [Gemmatimonadota bacterium]